MESPSQVDGEGAVYQAIEDRVPHGGIADELVPGLNRVLTGDEVGAGTLTVVEDLEEEAVLVGFEGRQCPKSSTTSRSTRASLLSSRTRPAIGLGYTQGAEEFGSVEVEGAESLPAGFVRQSAGPE